MSWQHVFIHRVITSHDQRVTADEEKPKKIQKLKILENQLMRLQNSPLQRARFDQTLLKTLHPLTSRSRVKRIDTATQRLQSYSRQSGSAVKLPIIIFPHTAPKLSN
ncbi:jg10674 [Pararge aegeria aegeria]|uniref:Jg10674 protein n=1 Tax=Pararge aegeria aegeria TaxID=348720 RepID=A0A8S4RSZ6_9NEOP|nr:jg10674 [Pararge aegeria aegeria]